MICIVLVEQPVHLRQDTRAARARTSANMVFAKTWFPFSRSRYGVTSLRLALGGRRRLRRPLQNHPFRESMVGSHNLNLEKWAQPLGDLNFQRSF